MRGICGGISMNVQNSIYLNSMIYGIQKGDPCILFEGFFVRVAGLMNLIWNRGRGGVATSSAASFHSLE